MLLGIVWNMDPEIIDGWRTPNWYGLCFVTGLILGYYVIKRMFKKENIPEQWLDKLLIYMVIATIVGARLGHVFFYDWPYYSTHPMEIIKVWHGGLASHGGAIGIVIALILYSKFVSKRSIWWILDRIAAPVAIAGCFIRCGNFFNSEILGIPTSLPWGVKFIHESINNLVNVNGKMVHVYRHPAQLYEAVGYLASFFILFRFYWKTRLKEKRGFIFGLFLVFIFGWRFIVEFVKVGQAARDAHLEFDTGQWLSVPFVVGGIIIMILANKHKLDPKKKDVTPETETVG